MYIPPKNPVVKANDSDFLFQTQLDAVIKEQEERSYEKAEALRENQQKAPLTPREIEEQVSTITRAALNSLLLWCTPYAEQLNYLKEQLEVIVVNPLQPFPQAIRKILAQSQRPPRPAQPLITYLLP